MIEIKITDLKNNVLFLSENVNQKDIFKKVEKIKDIKPPKYSKVLGSMDYLIDILEPTADEDDFIFDFVSNSFLDFTENKNKNDIIGRKFSSCLPALTEMGILESFLKLYKTDSISEHFFYVYDIKENGEKSLKHAIYQKVLRKDDKLYLLSRYDFKYLKLYEERHKQFDNSPNGLFIIQDNKIVKCNESYAKIINLKINEIEGSLINFNNYNFENHSPQEVKEEFNKLLYDEVYSFETIIKGKKNKWYQIYGKKMLYHEKDSIEIEVTDISNYKKLEKETLKLEKDLIELEKIVKIARCHSYDKKNFIWTDEIYDILEENPKTRDLKGVLTNYTIEEDIDRVRDIIINAQENAEPFEIETRIKLKNGKIKYVKEIGTNYYDKDGNFNGSGFIQDITEMKEYENELEKTNKEKADLLKEIHHRVKNNLQIILSFISLDERFYGDNPERIINSIKYRILTMALVHEQTYKSTDLMNLNVLEFTTKQGELLFKMYDSKKKIDIGKPDINPDLTLPMETLITLSLIGNEILTNSINHAFKDNQKECKIRLSIKEDEDYIYLTSHDNGVGLSEGFDIENDLGLGFTIIKMLTEQLSGEVKLHNDNGLLIKLKFPNPNIEKNKHMTTYN